jgi:two-component system NtrC family sensor kinase
MLGFLIIILLISVVFMFVGVRLISDRIVAEAQEKVRNDLNAAREIYLSQLTQINDVVRFTASRFFLREALASGNLELALDELIRIQQEEGLDVLTVTDKYGNVLLRTSNLEQVGDNLGHDDLLHAVLLQEKPIASTTLVASQDLYLESPNLAEQAYFKFIDTPLARDREETEETAGMMMRSIAPIFDEQQNFVGTIYGGVLISRNFEIVDKVKQTVYENVIYEGQDIGTATIFQDDLRISTNVRNEDGSRAIGTRVSEEVYNQVIIQGEPWIDRAYVVNNWYITAYEPIRDITNKIIGILYVGVLEQKYNDIRFIL